MAAGKGSKGPGSRKRPPARRPASGSKTTTTTKADSGAGETASGGPATSGGSAAPGKTKQTREERLEAARQARRRKATMVRAGVAGVVVVLVVIVAVVVVGNNNDAKATKNQLTAGSTCTYDTKADALDPAPANHTPPASYTVDPPAGGDHDPTPAAAGVYGGDGPPAPPDAQIVHALEHGYVAVWYRPDISAADLTAVRGAFDAFPNDVLVVPRPSLKGKTAATAWGRRLLCTDIEASRLTDFTRLYRNKGPERIPHT